MPGRGAWPFYYQFGLDRRNDPQGRDAHGIYAFKRELIFNGYGAGIVPDLAYWGKQVDDQTRKFQAAKFLVVDGQLGPKTAGILLRKRTLAIESRFGIVNNYLCKLKSHESANDPVAEGWSDPDDEGLVQINLDFHPTVTEVKAWDPAFALDWAGKYLFDAFKYTGDWDGAIVAYNIGRHSAKLWVEAGKPPTGGPLIGGQEGWKRATSYLAAINRAGC